MFEEKYYPRQNFYINISCTCTNKIECLYCCYIFIEINVILIFIILYMFYKCYSYIYLVIFVWFIVYTIFIIRFIISYECIFKILPSITSLANANVVCHKSWILRFKVKVQRKLPNAATIVMIESDRLRGADDWWDSWGLQVPW